MVDSIVYIVGEKYVERPTPGWGMRYCFAGLFLFSFYPVIGNLPSGTYVCIRGVLDTYIPLGTYAVAASWTAHGGGTS